MAKIRKFYISVWQKWAKKSILGQKRPNFGQKIENENFPAEFVLAIFLKYQKIGSYGKNQENI